MCRFNDGKHGGAALVATVATGAGRKGILLGPAMAEMAVDMMIGSQLGCEYSAFRPDRFGASG